MNISPDQYLYQFSMTTDYFSLQIFNAGHLDCSNFYKTLLQIIFSYYLYTNVPQINSVDLRVQRDSDFYKALGAQCHIACEGHIIEFARPRCAMLITMVTVGMFTLFLYLNRNTCFPIKFNVSCYSYQELEELYLYKTHSFCLHVRGGSLFLSKKLLVSSERGRIS